MQPPQSDAFHSLPEGPAPSQAATGGSSPQRYPQAGAPHPPPHSPYSVYPPSLQYPDHPSYYPSHTHPRFSLFSRVFGRIPPVYGAPPPPPPPAAAAPPPPPLPLTSLPRHPYSSSHLRHYRHARRGPRFFPWLLVMGGAGTYAYHKLAHRIEDVRDEVALGRQAERSAAAGQVGLLGQETMGRLGVAPSEGEGRKRWSWGCAHERKREREWMEQAKREAAARKAAELELARTGEDKGEESRML
ncbi:hypothetical protein JCM1841_000538 [Sporobolomyces salmonicolor]